MPAHRNINKWKYEYVETKIDDTKAIIIGQSSKYANKQVNRETNKQKNKQSKENMQQAKM